jgi:hypothetical protein
MPRCEHCGDPAARKDGKVVKVRGEPVCEACWRQMGQTDAKDFLDFLKRGGRMGGGPDGRKVKAI